MYNPNVNLNRLRMDDNPNYRSITRPINEENFYTEIPFRPIPLSRSLKDRVKKIFNSLTSSSKISSTEFYVNVNPHYAAITRPPNTPIEEETSEEEYSEIHLPPPLPPRNGLQGCNVDTNPIYVSADEQIYATIEGPTIPSRSGIEGAIVDDNPNYVSVETPPELPLRGLQFHTRFREQIRAWNSSFSS